LEFAFKIGRKEGVLGVEDKPKLWHKWNEVKHNFILNGSVDSSQTRGPTIPI
jgi:hypothetical protein